MRKMNKTILHQKTNHIQTTQHNQQYLFFLLSIQPNLPSSIVRFLLFVPPPHGVAFSAPS